MLLNLSDLKPNPHRDFHVDPLDESIIEQLKNSINDDGFWGGVVCRQVKNGVGTYYEIAAGHHRIEAAKQAGIAKAEVFVGKFDDSSMIRVYARENATQRNNAGTAVAGSVASAIKFLAKGIMSGLSRDFPGKSIEHARGNVANGRGVGSDLIHQFLENVPGMNQNIIKQQLANLKASGDYARIMSEVQHEIEEQSRVAQEELDRQEKESAKRRAAQEEANRLRQANEMAKQAADKAKETKITFDFEGVAKHFKNSNQIDHFRALVTSESILPYLPVKKQAALAKHLVDNLAAVNKELAKAGKPALELSARYIKENVHSMVLNVQAKDRELSKKEQEELLAKDWSARAHSYQEEFSRHCRGMLKAAMMLSDHAKERPGGVTLHATGEFKSAVEKAERAVALLRKAKVL